MKRVILALVIALSPAQAHKTAEWERIDRDTEKWFKSLRDKDGTPCCDISDGHATQWKIEGDSYWVLLPNGWKQVPDETILRRTPNKVGQAIVWYSNGLNDYHIRCFLPETEV